MELGLSQYVGYIGILIGLVGGIAFVGACLKQH